MVKRFISIISLMAISQVLLMPSCGNEDCLDLNQLDLLKTEMEEWLIDTTGHHITFRDQNNIRQTLVLTDYSSNHYDVIVEDDCGNTYGSWDYSAQYSMSVSPLNFMVNIRGSGNGDDGFYIEMIYFRTLGEFIRHAAVFDLINDESGDSKVRISYKDSMMVEGINYPGVLEFWFTEPGTPNDLEEIFFAKEKGIIMFKDWSGNQFVRENNGQ
jgi:hypothetical protein